MITFLRKKWAYCLGSAIILVIILFEAQGKGDFNIFISAARDLLLGKNIYTIQYNDWYHYYYDILFALVLIPFTYLPLYIVKVIWLLLNVFFVYRIWKIITDWIPLSLLNKNNKILFTVLSFIFIISFLRDNFHLSQLTICILYLMLEGLSLINKGKKITGSLLIALGISIKILPIVIIPYLIYRNQWKSALFVLGFVIALLLIPIAFIGYEYNNFLLLERWKLINPANQANILDSAERSFHSLTTLLTTLLVKDTGDWQALHLKRNIADITVANLNIVINIVRGAFILFFLYFLNTKPFKNTTIPLQQLYEFSYLCLIIPLIFPHQQHYAFFFIFPASTYLIYYLIYLFFNNQNFKNVRYFKAKKIILIVSLSIAFISTNSHFLLGQFNQFYDHFKTLTYGVLILLVILAFCKPGNILINKKLQENN